MKKIKLRYSEPLLKEAVRAFFFRVIARGFGLRFFAVWAVVAICMVQLLSHGDRGWLIGVLGATLIFTVVVFSMIYLAHYRHTIGRFRQMRVPEATLSYGEEEFTLASELGSATMPWKAVTEVWRYPRFWLVLFSRSQFTTFPLDCLDAETQAFILSKTQK